MYLNARTLDPATGQFMAADTVQPNAGGTQGYNLYAYAANNPTTQRPNDQYRSQWAWGGVPGIYISDC